MEYNQTPIHLILTPDEYNTHMTALQTVYTFALENPEEEDSWIEDLEAAISHMKNEAIAAGHALTSSGSEMILTREIVEYEKQRRKRNMKFRVAKKNHIKGY